MGITQIKEWYRRIKNGRTSVDSDSRSGRPSLATTPENIERVWLAIEVDCKGVVHYEFAPRGQTIHNEYYVEVLKRLRDAVRRKRPRFWSSGDWLLHCDNNANAFIENSAASFGETQGSTASSASVQSRHSSLRLLDVPKIEDGAQKKAVWRHREDSE